MWHPLDQPISLHAVQGVRHGGLLDLHGLAELLLGDVVTFVEGEKLGELSRDHSVWSDCLA